MGSKHTAPTPRRWYFVFTDDNTTPFRWLLRRRFRHCYAFTELADGLCFIIDPLMQHVVHEMHDRKLHELVAFAKLSGGRVVMARLAPQHRILPRSILITCASYLAYTVGLPFFGITPYHLFTALIKHGAEEV